MTPHLTIKVWIEGDEVHYESHCTPCHPELQGFMCGKAIPDACIPVLREAFKAERVEVNEILRGQGA